MHYPLTNVGIPALRLRGDYLAIVTLAFGEIVKSLFQNTSDETFGGTLGLDTPRYDKTYLFVIAFVLVLIVIVIYNNAPKLKAFRDTYNLGALMRRFKKHDPAHINDDKAKWDVVPTKISMGEVLSVDFIPQNLGPDKKGGDK